MSLHVNCQRVLNLIAAKRTLTEVLVDLITLKYLALKQLRLE